MIEPQRRILKGYFLLACKQYEPLICKLAFAIGVNSTHAEELRACGKNELLKCMICYDGRGSFMTFLYGRLSGIFRHMRDVENRVRRIRSVPIDLMNNLIRPKSYVDWVPMVATCMACLTKEEYVVIHELFFAQRTMREISQEHGIPHSTVCRIKHKSLDKMRRKHRLSGVNDERRG